MRTRFASVVVVGARLLLLCATSATLGPGMSIAASGQDALHYHYFKERRPLKLETQRVAILQARTTAAEGLGQALSRFGLAPEGRQVLPIAGWSLAGTPAASHTEPATRDLVSRMSGESAFAFVAPLLAGEDGGPNIVTPDLLVGFEPSVTEQRAEAILAELNAGDIVQRHFGNMKGAYHLRTRLKNGFDVLDVANKLAERPEVRFAEPDMIFTGQGDLIPNDPGFTNLWAMQNTEQFGGGLEMDMKAPQAWDITTGSSNIIVVILDVGVQPDHPDLNQIPGTNFTSDASFDGGPVNACDNHGTAVAGCVSAIINNSIGTVGIAPGCRCASARAFIANSSCDNGWTGQFSWTVNALAWAQNIGARVSNNSNKYGFQSSAIADEYAFTRGMGMVHFAAAGNDATNSIWYPANLPGVNAVAAVNEGGGLASFSNHGTGLGFSAPGQQIYTTDRTGGSGYTNGDYVFAYGTSVASPYAAGVAALVLSVNPSLSATNVERILQQSCVDLGPPGYDTTYGWGLVNAYNAVTLAQALPPATIPVTSTADSGAGTLRAALASARNGDTIDASGVSGAIFLTSGELLVTNSVSILGPGPANLAVDGTATSRAFNISGTVVTLAGLTITNGKASGGGFPSNSGGGLYTGPGTLTITNCAFSGNSAQFDGGGILANHSILTLSACTFGTNVAGTNGGGVFINAVFGTSTLIVSDCAFNGNSANADSGGAIYNNPQASGNATAQIANTTFGGNSAGYGAGIFNDGKSAGSATLTVSNCTLSHNSASGNGGGIFNQGYTGNARLTVSASTLSSNSAANSLGGGIFNQGYSGHATVTVSASTLSGNASGNGGGIFNNGNSGSGTLTVSNCIFSGNTASNDSGGGIYNNGQASGNATAQILHSTLSGNSAGYGAGIYNDGHSSGSATLTVNNCTLTNNSASGWGGGIFNGGSFSGTGTVSIVNCTLSGNSASNDRGGGIFNQGYNGNAMVTLSASTLSGNWASDTGGGIYNNGASGSAALTVSTSTLSGNLAGGAGGAIYNDGTSSGKATLTVKASTLSGNSASGGSGGGILNNGGGGSARLEIGSSILKAGAAGGNLANLSGAVISDGYNLVSDDAGALLLNFTDQLNTDPMLGPLQDNGGPTFTHALLPGSPAIDKGRNLTGSATDQRGSPRTMDSPCIANASGGNGTDIGALEVQQPCPLAVSLGHAGAVLSQFGFDIAGGSNQVVVVETSTNLVSWTALATNTLGAAPLHFNDAYWTNFPQRFYRTKLVP